MERLPWTKSAENEFVASPDGKGKVRVWFKDTAPPEAQWWWTVDTRHFTHSGYAGTPQAAAADATSSWYALIEQPPPRDIEGDCAKAVAAIEAGEFPEALVSDETLFLHRLMNALRDKHLPGQNPPPPPEHVRKAMARLSEELFRRRVG